MINKETKQVILTTFESLQSQLETMLEKADIIYRARIKMALSSIEAGRSLLSLDKDLENVLYLLGRGHWTLGFIMGSPKKEPVQIETTGDDVSEITKVTRLPNS